MILLAIVGATVLLCVLGVGLKQLLDKASETQTKEGDK